MHDGFDHYVIDPSGPSDQHDLIEEIKLSYECIISCEYAWRYLGAFSGLKVAVVDDLHRWGRHRVDHDTDILGWADIILSTYHFTDKHCNYPGSISTEQRRQFVYFPHFAIDVPAPPFPYESRDFAIVPGAAVENFYPMRFLARQIDGVAIPGAHGLKELSREDFIRQLGRYKVGITCNLTLRYVVAKYFEIPMAGTALLASDIPHPLEKYLLGFDESNSSLIPSSKEEDLDYISKCANELAYDKDKWTDITNKGRSLVRSRHTPASRYKYIYSIVCSVLAGRWRFGDQYDHFIASWQESYKPNGSQVTKEGVSHGVTSAPQLKGRHVLVVEPDKSWWSDVFPHSSGISGDYTSSNSRVRLSIPSLNDLNEINGLHSALLKVDGPYDCIVVHESFGLDVEIIGYLLTLLNPEGHLHISISAGDPKNLRRLIEQSNYISDAEFLENHILIIDKPANESANSFDKSLIENLLLSSGQANKFMVRKLLRDFWLRVAQRTQEMVGTDLIVSIDDKFWIDYGALRIWSGDNERRAARVNLESICHDHIYIGIQGVDFEESYAPHRAGALKICEEFSLSRSSDHFLGYEFFNDLALPTLSLNHLVADEIARHKFINTSEDIKETIAVFISRIISRLISLENNATQLP